MGEGVMPDIVAISSFLQDRLRKEGRPMDRVWGFRGNAYVGAFGAKQ